MGQGVWDVDERRLHWALAVTVTFQQFSSVWMSDPGSQYLFPYHRIVGGVAAGVLLLYWLRRYAYGGFDLLFPWGRAARREVFREGMALFRGRLPSTGRRVGLSGFIHGLGLLALTGCAVTGMVMFGMIPPGHVGPPADPLAFTRYTLMHKWFGQLLWLYWWGHVAFAVVHQLAGDRVFGAIFRLRD
jgi:cytochrome b561